jgi:hypothetical protein
VELICFIVGLVIGAWCSTVFNRWIFSQVLERLGVDHKRLKKLAHELESEVTEPQEQQTTQLLIKLEEHNGVIFAYNRETMQFLAQGTDANALIKHLDLTFANGARLIVREADGAELLQKSHS